MLGVVSQSIIAMSGLRTKLTADRQTIDGSGEYGARAESYGRDSRSADRSAEQRQRGGHFVSGLLTLSCDCEIGTPADKGKPATMTLGGSGGQSPVAYASENTPERLRQRTFARAIE